MNHDDVVKATPRGPRFAPGDRVTVSSPRVHQHGKSGVVTGIFSTRLGVHRTYVTLDGGARLVLAETHFEPEEKIA